MPVAANASLAMAQETRGTHEDMAQSLQEQLQNVEGEFEGRLAQMQAEKQSGQEALQALQLKYTSDTRGLRLAASSQHDALLRQVPRAKFAKVSCMVHLHSNLDGELTFENF